MSQQDETAKQLLCAAGAMLGFGDSRSFNAVASASCRAGQLGAEEAGVFMTYLFERNRAARVPQQACPSSSPSLVLQSVTLS